MLHPFVQIDEELVALTAQTTLLTPNERLAREYKRAVNFHKTHEQRDQGSVRGWLTPNVMSLRQYVRRAYLELVEARGLANNLLSDAALIHAAKLTRPAASGQQLQHFVTAWHTMADYDIPQDPTDEAFFHDWADATREKLPKGTVLESQIPDKLIALNWQPTQALALITPDEITRPQARLIAYLQEQNTLQLLPIARPSRAIELSQCKLFQCDSIEAELYQAAHWAKEVKSNHAERDHRDRRAEFAATPSPSSHDIRACIGTCAR